ACDRPRTYDDEGRTLAGKERGIKTPPPGKVRVAMGALGDIAAIYRASKKKKDINLWTEWVCRPPAAAFVWLLQGTRVTPNQVTFLATLVAFGAAALFILLPGWSGAIVA